MAHSVEVYGGNPISQEMLHLVEVYGKNRVSPTAQEGCLKDKKLRFIYNYLGGDKFPVIFGTEGLTYGDDGGDRVAPDNSKCK